MNHTIITPEVGDKIAALFNSLEVATIMVKDAVADSVAGRGKYKGDVTAARYWMDDYNETADKLALLGINLKVRYPGGA